MAQPETEPSKRLLAGLRDPRLSCLIVTGAGISRASGIDTFRGPDPAAIWNVSDVDMATCRMLERDPVAHWSWYLDRFSAVDSAQPNPAHRAVSDLEHWADGLDKPFAVVTQNIDPLHEKAGSQALIKVHGTTTRLRCTATRCRLAAPIGSVDRSDVDLESFRKHPTKDTLPKCVECQSLLRPHVLFFDEYYDSHQDYQINQVLSGAARSNLIIFVGTSFSVGVTDMIIRTGWESNAGMFSIDPHAAPPAGSRIIHLSDPAEDFLPSLVAELETGN